MTAKQDLMQTTKNISQDVLDRAEELGVGEGIYTIMDITREMFPGQVAVEIGHDPEWPEDRYITFIVEVRGEMKDFVAKHLEWHDRITDFVGERPEAIGLSFF